jgi:hypothetical protein
MTVTYMDVGGAPFAVRTIESTYPNFPAVVEVSILEPTSFAPALTTGCEGEVSAIAVP